MDVKRYTIGELANSTGLTVRTLHHYDRIGLLVASQRTHSGYRLYGRKEVERLYRILALRQLGLALNEIHTPTHRRWRPQLASSVRPTTLALSRRSAASHD